MSQAVDLQAIGFRAERFPPLEVPEDARLVRLIEQHRTGFVVHDGRTAFAAKALPRLRHVDADDRPCVGDFARARPQGNEWILDALLPRYSALVRAAAGERYARQAIAANIDHVLIVCGLDRDFNPRRLERYLALVSASGARPCVVLTKADLNPDAAHLLADLGERLPQVQILAANAKDGPSCRPLFDLLGPGQTAVLVGSSGAGKSTLTNTLLGHEAQRTGAIREQDGRGRHTTVSRALKHLASGACLIDTPGLREIKLTGDEDLVEAGFDDIEILAGECRFRDCRHDQEPGCAVRAAVQAGQLRAERLEHWRKLGAEIHRASRDALGQKARKQQVVSAQKGLRESLRDKARRGR